MLPPIGITYNITFKGVTNTIPVSGVFAIQTVTTQDEKAIIGYRLWQGYTGQTNEVIYTVSYTNGTGFQASVKPDTQECISVYPQQISCTGWSSANNLIWKNLCSDLSTEESKSIAKMTVDADASDLKRSVSLNITITMDSLPYKLFSTYQFSSKTEGKIFPHVKCGF
ncbi:unnamed protein product [Rotaria sordida]|uniref:Uncharacterized protein n=1 Tax=Rotaria sordida TaxID=392033 RepID=A0A819STD8_9BILA|nr:unnamed protein product [Rotaria sordida]CAF1268302.1 unnamed protein product [Rotaria sordida]CAF1415643.1 unnamed protein product [Rotaria sordida]CAF3812554.1 unnamed protein product [Rotaria sordida]CAF3935141.1 unnamed protein product [Rotaria sordida]